MGNSNRYVVLTECYNRLCLVSKLKLADNEGHFIWRRKYIFFCISALIGGILLKLPSFPSDVKDVRWPYYMQNKGHFPLYLIFNRRNFLHNSSYVGGRLHAVAQLVEALHDTVEGRGFDIRGEFLKRRTAHCECNTTYVGFVVSVL